MSITSARLEQIRIVETEISNKVDWITTEKKKLENILDTVEGISSSMRDQMSRSASSSSKKKGRGETVSIDEAVTRYKGIIQNMKNAIAEEEQRVEELKKEKVGLENYEIGN
ncbi:hypothetical protein FOPG_16491 [Fusarium oxysporum f. sp. conglutinans race 2 54008]|uniref:Uncharacterized protein n=2 Tax=Fusarium oxysporum TaxID=5507 RepID=X0M883_FUSOX|nr:hypothetical protein FOPG_16491 [Fusarium oxysporum f. sp. conglutinans race 2 54008]EXM16850.1 hypothetical protein FOTG_14890 [Fusarium oxysporum f. sp. vasinfectum 25433]